MWGHFIANDSLMGETTVELYIDNDTIRTRETNFGNFMADLFRNYHQTDCAFVNSGSLRYGKNVPVGPIWSRVFKSSYNN